MLLCKEGTSSKTHQYGLEMNRTDTLLPGFLYFSVILQLPQWGICSSLPFVSIQEQKAEQMKGGQDFANSAVASATSERRGKMFQRFWKSRANLVRWRGVLLPEAPLKNAPRRRMWMLRELGLGGCSRYLLSEQLHPCSSNQDQIKVSLNQYFCMKSCSSKVIVQKPKHVSSHTFCL